MIIDLTYHVKPRKYNQYRFFPLCRIVSRLWTFRFEEALSLSLVSTARCSSSYVHKKLDIPKSIEEKQELYTLVLFNNYSIFSPHIFHFFVTAAQEKQRRKRIAV